jgi:hypothetical protein
LLSERNDVPSVWRTAWRQRLDEIQIPPG